MHARSLSMVVFIGALAACAREAAPPAGPNVVTIVATDFAFAVPETLPPGLTTFRLANAGAEPHHSVLFKLADGKTVADFQAVAMSATTPDWITLPGSPAAIMPNDTSNTTTMLAPGQYVLVCYVPSPDGAPHIAKGMVKGFVVAGAAPAAAAEPTPDVVVTMSDYTFAFSTPLTAGAHTVRVENAGPQVHEITFERLADGKSLQDYVAWGKAGMKGPPPSHPVGGVIGPTIGGHAYFTISLTPGKYLVLCYVPDEKDQKAHVEHGMIQEITIN